MVEEWPVGTLVLRGLCAGVIVSVMADKGRPLSDGVLYCEDATRLIWSENLPNTSAQHLNLSSM